MPELPCRNLPPVPILIEPAEDLVEELVVPSGLVELPGVNVMMVGSLEISIWRSEGRG